MSTTGCQGVPARCPILTTERIISSPAADILIVNWNGAFFLEHLLPLALELTDPEHRFSVWDNASRDDSWPVLSCLADRHAGRLRAFRSLPNMRHGGGLRRLLARSDRELLVVMDCDATPLRSDWVAELARPVLDGAAACGIPHGSRDRYVHPSCLCTTRSALRELSVDVRPSYPDFDVMQRLSAAATEAGRPLSFVEPDGGFLFSGFGRTYGDGLVYHHWFGTRVNPVEGLAETPEGRTVTGLAESQRALEAWLRERGQWREAETPKRARLLGTAKGVIGAHGPAWLQH